MPKGAASAKNFCSSAATVDAIVSPFRRLYVRVGTGVMRAHAVLLLDAIHLCLARDFAEQRERERNDAADVQRSRLGNGVIGQPRRWRFAKERLLAAREEKNPFAHANENDDHDEHEEECGHRSIQISVEGELQRFVKLFRRDGFCFGRCRDSDAGASGLSPFF